MLMVEMLAALIDGLALSQRLHGSGHLPFHLRVGQMEPLRPLYPAALRREVCQRPADGVQDSQQMSVERRIHLERVFTRGALQLREEEVFVAQNCREVVEQRVDGLRSPLQHAQMQDVFAFSVQQVPVQLKSNLLQLLLQVGDPFQHLDYVNGAAPCHLFLQGAGGNPLFRPRCQPTPARQN